MKKFICMILTAFSACAVFACEDCDKKAASTAAQEYINDISALLPKFSSFGKKVKNSIELLDKEKKVIAYLRVAPDKKYERKEGFNNHINTAIVFSTEGKILGVVIGKNEETPRFIEKIRDAGFMKRWNGKTSEQAKKMNVDSISGATWSCEAIKSEISTILNEK